MMSEAKNEASELNDLLCVAEKMCKHTPPGYVIILNFEEGACFVQLGKDGIGFIDLPDSADKTILEQLNDALCVANGFDARIG